MNSEKQNSKLPVSELGDLLRYWRNLRGKSQFDLSLDTGGSQRHISFVENGRSVPSRQILIGLLRHLIFHCVTGTYCCWRRAMRPSTPRVHGMRRK